MTARVDGAAEFLIAAVTEPDNPGRSSLLKAAERVRSWDRVVDLATRHGVAAYGRRAMRLLPTQLSTEERLRAAELSAIAITLLLEATLRRVAQAFTQQGIDFMVLKGPVLARSIYPDRTLRPYGDIDVVVRPAQLADAIGALMNLGFREIPYDAEIARLAFIGAGAVAPFQRMFVDATGRSLVELHVEPLQLGIRPKAEEDRWRRAIPATGIAGALALGDEDALVQLCVHAHKHGFNRLIWLKDLDLFVRTRAATVDWELVTRIARTEGVASSVWFALSLARTILATPQTPAADLKPPLPLRAVYEIAWQRRHVRSLEVVMRRRAVQFHAAESWRGMVPSMIFMERRAERFALLVHALRTHDGRSTKAQPRGNGASTIRART